MMSHQNKALPTAIAAKLRSIRIRHTLLTLLRGLAIGLAIFLLAMVLAMSIDWLVTLFSSAIRISLTATTFILAICGFAFVVVPRLRTILKSTQAAVDADEAIPQLQERWTTVASFAEASQQPTSSTSKAMLEQVHSEALAMQRLVNPANVVRPTSLKPAFASLGTVSLFTAAFMALNLQQTSVLIKRFFAPTQNITATQFASTTGDITIPRGEVINLEAEATGLLRKSAILTVENETGIVDVFEISADQDSPEKFVHEMRAEESLRYRLRSGDGLTDWFSVNVIDYPEIAEVDLKIEPPEYLSRPGIEKTLIPSRVKVIQGSRLKLRLKPVEQLKNLSLRLSYENSEGEQQTSELSLQPESDGWYRFETQLVEDLTFSPELLSPHGLKNEDQRICHIQVIEDMAPVARIINPTDEMAVAADDTIEIEFEAHDDHGIAKAELVIYDESNLEEGETPEILEVREIPLGEQQLQKHLMVKTTLDLEELGLREGTSISYSIRVSDNRELKIDPQKMLAQSSEAKPEEKSHSNEESDTASEDGSLSEKPESSEMLTMAEHSQTDENQAEGSSTKPDGATDESAQSEEPSEIAANEVSENSQDKNSSPLAESKTTNPSTGNTNENPTDPSVTTEDERAEALVKSPKNKAKMSEEGTRSTSPRSQSNDDESLAESTSEANRPSNSNDSNASEHPDNESVRSQNSLLASSNPEETERSGVGQPSSPDEVPAEDMESPSESNAATNSEEVAAKDDNTKIAPALASESPEDTPSENLASNESTPNNSGQNNNNSESSESKNENSPSDEMLAGQQNDQSKGNGGGQRNNQQPQQNQPLPSKPIRMTAQNSESNQNTETNRRILKITERLTGVAKAAKNERQVSDIRDKVVAIDTMLEDILSGLERLIQREIPDADRGLQYERLDGQLGEVETYISKLHEETEEGEYAFVGLQMVDVARTHVTPARDRVFAAVRNPITSDRDTTIAKGNVVRARELLAALLARYDRVTRDNKLAESIEDSIEIYEVYVEKMQKLMRERRQNKNPLKREMAVIEVDQEYLDRYAEVLTLRREMMREFGRMLSDDPRLLARYMDLIKRRNSSLRDQLTELSERQDETAYELSGWLAADDVQQEDVWTIVVEMRLFAAEELAEDAAELSERVSKQLPLTLEATDPLAVPVIEHAEAIAELSRTISFDSEELLLPKEDREVSTQLQNSGALLEHFGQLDGALDRLIFERDGDEEIEDYVNARLADSRRVADQSVRWKHMIAAILERQYNKLVELDQWQLNVATELLRIEMLEFESQINDQFQQQGGTPVPGEIVDLIRKMHGVMEAITFHQSSATFAAQSDRLALTEIQQTQALEKFEMAEDLFDKIRRAVIAELDQYDVDDPNIADLQDPTLDQFLAQLEREPNIQAQLGIPNRPSNLRVVADSMSWQQNGGGLGDSAGQARMRAKKAMEMAQAASQMQQKKDEKPQGKLSEEEKEQMKKAQQMQEMLEKSLAALEEQRKNPETPPEELPRLERMKKNLQRMLREVGEQQTSAEEWERIVQRDQAAEILKALAAGKPVPDEQWNKLLSTLEDGLWQVRGKRPPEEYLPAIEQYQDRLRELLSTVPNGAE